MFFIKQVRAGGSQQASPPLTGVGRSIIGAEGMETVVHVTCAGVDSDRILQAKFMLNRSSPLCWFLLCSNRNQIQ